MTTAQIQRLETSDVDQINLPAWDTLPQPSAWRTEEAYSKSSVMISMLVATSFMVLFPHGGWLVLVVPMVVTMIAILTFGAWHCRRIERGDRLRVLADADTDQVTVLARDTRGETYGLRRFSVDDEMAAIEYAATLRLAIEASKEQTEPSTVEG